MTVEYIMCVVGKPPPLSFQDAATSRAPSPVFVGFGLRVLRTDSETRILIILLSPGTFSLGAKFSVVVPLFYLLFFKKLLPVFVPRFNSFPRVGAQTAYQKFASWEKTLFRTALPAPKAGGRPANGNFGMTTLGLAAPLGCGT